MPIYTSVPFTLMPVKVSTHRVTCLVHADSDQLHMVMWEGYCSCILSCIIQEFMTSEGIELNPPSNWPPDPYMESRRQPQHTYTTPSTYDKLQQFLEMDRQVLRFYCMWDDRENMFGEMRPYVSTNKELYAISANYYFILTMSHPSFRVVYGYCLSHVLKLCLSS